MDNININNYYDQQLFFKRKRMNYITVLDFEAGRVFQYELPSKQHEEHEEYLTIQGHNLQNCEWMVHKNPQIITN